MEQKTEHRIQNTEYRSPPETDAVFNSLSVRLEKGTAFILVVMLVTLLAVIGTMFLLRARVGRLSASAMRQNSELNNAVDTVVAAISQQLIVDTPGVDVDSNGVPRQEYYDYPDATNAWLANLEPFLFSDNGTPNDPNDDIYYWRQISDVTGYLKNKNFPTQNISVKPVGLSTTVYVREYPVIKVDSEGRFLDSSNKIAVNGVSADADGDGIADSKWIELTDITTGRGEPVYAAIRVVDNGGMLNVNTAYKFDPCSTNKSDIDGSSQLQINLAELSQRGANGNLKTAAEKLHLWRCNNDISKTLSSYEPNVIWQYGNPGGYTPFDISDELKLRNRYLLNFNEITTRIEKLWTNAYDRVDLTVPVDDSNALVNWKKGAVLDTSETSLTEKYDFRHISTTYNMDRIINPLGQRMVNIQNINSTPNVLMLYDNAQNLYETLLPCIRDVPAGPVYDTLDAEFAQIAANIKDYSDSDTEVTTVRDNFGTGTPHYGYERPEIRISELVYGDRYLDPNLKNPQIYDPCDPNCSTKYLHRSYAIEISNDFVKDVNYFNDWQLVINTPGVSIPPIPPIPITSARFDERGGRFYVAIFEDPCAMLSDSVYWLDSPADGAKGVDPNVILRWSEIWGRDANGVWSKANAYDVYFGTDRARVRDANTNVSLWPEYQGPQPGNFFDPFGSVPMAQGETYYWRVAGVNNVVIDDGNPPWRFTTWDKPPQIVFGGVREANSPPVFGPDSIIRLERWVKDKPGYIVVDMLGPVDGTTDSRTIPDWLVDPNGADRDLRVRSFQRDLSWPGRLKRLWQYNSNDPNISIQTLGHWNNFDWQISMGIQLPPLQVQHHRLNNVGELGFIFKKSAYYEAADRIDINDTELDIKVNLTDASVQKMFNFLTVMDPYSHGKDANEVRVQGRININTAPWFVLAQLPWVSTHNNPIPNYDLAKAIVAHRDNWGGFENIGQLNNITEIQYYGGDMFDQQGYPDLTTDRRSKVDGYPNDQEERDLIFARISDLVTVRSDVFTAYILVRLGQNGPQKRVMAILDRSDVQFDKVSGRVADSVKIRALYPVPDAR